MQTEVYNQNAIAAALRVLGGQQLVDAFPQLYSVIAIAERSGYEGGFEAGRLTVQVVANDEGYEEGYADGHADGLECFVDDNAVKANAHDEGEDMSYMFEGGLPRPDWELAKAVAALG